ncbi:unnamed protein product, partial [Iphiclides podalirius]
MQRRLQRERPSPPPPPPASLRPTPRTPPPASHSAARRLRNLRRRIPFIAARDSISRPRPPLARRLAIAQPSLGNRSQYGHRPRLPGTRGRTSALFRILERYATFLCKVHAGRPV